MEKSRELLDLEQGLENTTDNYLDAIQEAVAEAAQAEAGDQEDETTVELPLNTRIAAALLTQTIESGVDDTLALYEKNDLDRDVITHTIDLGKKKTAKALFLSELMVGHQDSQVQTYLDTLDRVAELPKAMKPDVIVISGIVQGDFKFFEKPRRATLIPEFNSMDTQFRHGRNLIRRAQELDIPVIYNMGDDDARVSEDYTVLAFNDMHKHAKEDKSVSWSAIDKTRMHPMFYEHLRFQKEFAYPYCLRAGRRLRTAEEMSKLTEELPEDQQIDIDEYYVLFSKWLANRSNDEDAPDSSLVLGNLPNEITEDQLEFTDAYQNWLDSVAETQLPELLVTDDLNLVAKTGNGDVNIVIRHYAGYSPTPMYVNHLKGAKIYAGNLIGSGQPVDLLVTQHNHEGVGTSLGNHSWAISTPGLIDPVKSANTRSSRQAKGDISRRLLARGRAVSPGATMHELGDGRHIITVFNEALMEKSFSLGERLTIAEVCDLQFGSISARPDLLVKYFDIIRQRAIGAGATALFFGGDHLHGHNYQNFKNESQATGLMAMDSQEDFGVRIFNEAFRDAARAELEAIERILVQPGNHEWNSGTYKGAAHGYHFTAGLRNAMEMLYAYAGFSREEVKDRIQTHEAIITAEGDYLTGTNAVVKFGEYGTLLRHYMLDRGANSSGGEPIYQAHGLAYGGSAGLLRDVDFFMAGHFHHPQYGLFGDKLAIIGGSMAGMTDYEFNKGYKATVAGNLIHIGGGLPVQIEFIGVDALHQHKVKHGGFTDKALREEGFRTDRGFDPARNGLLTPDPNAPLSGIQKKVLHLMRQASLREGKIAHIG